MNTQQSIAEKVRKLLRLAAKNNSPEEAAAAASKAQALIDDYNLSNAMLALDGQEDEPDEPIEDFGKKGAPLDKQSTKLARWRYYLAYHFAEANACKLYAEGGAIHIIGRASDADTVRYLFAYCAGEIDRLTDQNGRGCGTVWRNNFRLGCIDTIARKIRESRKSRMAALRLEAQEQGTTALMRVDNALARVDRRLATVKEWTKQNLKLRSGSSSSIQQNSDARARGRIAGESINVGSRARAALNQGN